MSAFSRNKGKRGERSVAALIRDLLGCDAQRRVRQHDGDSDVLGVPGWSIEVKDCADLRLPEWWRQAVEQAGPHEIPCLWFKVPRKGWRVRWPLSCLLVEQRASQWLALEWTAETTPEAWAAVVRDVWAGVEGPRSADRQAGNGVVATRRENAPETLISEIA